uniref:Uncharacterized protein n=1 Tax=Sander lucioperca TaxID=283035 RepID=A0A8C9Z7T1_SANLU
THTHTHTHTLTLFTPSHSELCFPIWGQSGDFCFLLVCQLVHLRKPTPLCSRLHHSDQHSFLTLKIGTCCWNVSWLRILFFRVFMYC